MSKRQTNPRDLDNIPSQLSTIFSLLFLSVHVHLVSLDHQKGSSLLLRSLTRDKRVSAALIRRLATAIIGMVDTRGADMARPADHRSKLAPNPPRDLQDSNGNETHANDMRTMVPEIGAVAILLIRSAYRVPPLSGVEGGSDEARFSRPPAQG